MSSPTIIQSRLDELLNGGFVARGAHDEDSGERCIQEWCAYIAGESHSYMPSCVSPVLRRYTVALNDRWSDDQRQALAPYGPRMIGTAGDGLDDARLEIAHQALVTDLLPAWLRLAGMDAEAEALAAVPLGDLGSHLYRLRDAAWARRRAVLEPIRQAVQEQLAGRAVAVAVAAAVAVADAVAAADADAAAVAVAVADADADAAAAAAAAADDPWASWDAAYKAAYPIMQKAIAESAAPRLVAIRELAAAQRTVALDVLERMIRPEATQ